MGLHQPLGSGSPSADAEASGSLNASIVRRVSMPISSWHAKRENSNKLKCLWARGVREPQGQHSIWSCPESWSDKGCGGKQSWHTTHCLSFLPVMDGGGIQGLSGRCGKALELEPDENVQLAHERFQADSAESIEGKEHYKGDCKRRTAWYPSRLGALRAKAPFTP
eukprot:1160143-Pelagomonas_calceolata.AAC.9